VIWSEERGGERVGMVERQSQREKFILTTLAMADEIYLAVQVLWTSARLQMEEMGRDRE